MLKSYEAIYKQGQLIWLTDTPPLLDDMPVRIVTHLEPNKFTPQAVEAMLQRTVGALGNLERADIDRQLQQMRNEWDRG
jgi:hypothetical protein